MENKSVRIGTPLSMISMPQARLQLSLSSTHLLPMLAILLLLLHSLGVSLLLILPLVVVQIGSNFLKELASSFTCPLSWSLQDDLTHEIHQDLWR